MEQLDNKGTLRSLSNLGRFHHQSHQFTNQALLSMKGAARQPYGGGEHGPSHVYGLKEGEMYIRVPRDSPDNPEWASRSKTQLLSRHNVQSINKKYRQIRLSEMKSTACLYAGGHDPITPRPQVADGSESYKSQALTGRKIQAPKISASSHRNNPSSPIEVESERNMRWGQRVSIKSEPHKQKSQKQEIYLRCMDGERPKVAGNISKKFYATARCQSQKDLRQFAKVADQKGAFGGLVTRMHKKTIYDNVNVMAMVIRRKIRHLGQEQAVRYIRGLCGEGAGEGRPRHRRVMGDQE